LVLLASAGGMSLPLGLTGIYGVISICYSLAEIACLIARAARLEKAKVAQASRPVVHPCLIRAQRALRNPDPGSGSLSLAHEASGVNGPQIFDN
jgi:hypothetical protein